MYFCCCSDETFFSDVEVASCFFLWRLLCSHHSATGGVSLAVERTRGRVLGLHETVLALPSPMDCQEIHFILKSKNLKLRLKPAKHIDQYATFTSFHFIVYGDLCKWEVLSVQRFTERHSQVFVRVPFGNTANLIRDSGFPV